MLLVIPQSNSENLDPLSRRGLKRHRLVYHIVIGLDLLINSMIDLSVLLSLTRDIEGKIGILIGEDIKLIHLHHHHDQQFLMKDGFLHSQDDQYRHHHQHHDIHDEKLTTGIFEMFVPSQETIPKIILLDDHYHHHQ